MRRRVVVTGMGKSGIIGNRHGVLVGRYTSGPEMQRVDEVFMLR